MSFRYSVTIAVTSLMNVQGHTDAVKNSPVDAAYRADQAKLGETQFAYMQTTTLQDRHHPRRIKLSDVDIQSTEEMKGFKFEAPKISESDAQYQGMPEIGPMDSQTDLQRFMINAIAELNFLGRNYHNNKRSVTQRNGWYAFERNRMRDSNGRLIRSKAEAKELIQAKQFLMTIPKVALQMVKLHAVFIRAGIQVQYFLPGHNNLTRLMKNFLAFNSKITKDMFKADPSLETPFSEQYVQYKRAVELIPTDRPMLLIAPTFTSTKRATNLLSDHMPIKPQDQVDRQKFNRYNAYIDTHWVDGPHLVVTMIANSNHRPIQEYRIQSHSHRVFLSTIGKMDMPMIMQDYRTDYDQVLKWGCQLQPGERQQLHQIMNSRPRIEHMLMINRLQHDRDDDLT